MSSQITITDQQSAGRVLDVIVIDVPSPHITVRELIEYRVQEEVRRHNADLERPFRGLVQPAGSEATARGFVMRSPKPVDWRRQVEVACEGFEQGEYFILVGDRQVERLDEFIDLERADEATFIKLVPLVGG